MSKKRFPSKPCYYHHEMPGTSQDAIDEDAAIEHQLAIEESEELERQIAIKQLKELESEEELERESKDLLGEEDTEESMEIDYDLSTKEQELLLGQDTMEVGEQESIGTTPTGAPVKCQNNESTVTQKEMNQVMSNMKRKIGAREKREMGARIARKMLPEFCIIKTTDNSLNGNDTQGSDDPIMVDLVNEEPEDKDRSEEVTLEKLMRFYHKTGKCYICDTSWSSETEVKKHLLYVHLIIIDDNDPDAIHFVKNRVSKKIYVGTGKNKKPMLEYINCGNGPFYNNFGIVQHKIEDCEANAEDSKKLNKDVKNMSFNIEYVRKVYSDLNRPYYIEV